MNASGGARAVVRRSYIDGRFGQMHLRAAAPARPDQVRGRAVLCFHLSPVSGAIFENLLAELGQDRIAIAPDTPGYGASDAPPVAPEIADYAAAMGELMDSLGLDEVDCIGMHTGSKIALELALQRPAAVRHLVLISTPVYTDEELAGMRREFAPVAPRDDGTHLTDYWRTLLEWRGPEQSNEDIMRYFPDHLRGGEHRHWGHRAAFNYSYPQHLPRASQPILVLNNGDDLQRYTPRALQYMQHGRLLERPDWGHGFLDRNTVEFAAIVRGFCDEAAPEVGA